MSVEYTNKFIKKLPPHIQKLFREQTDDTGDILNVFRLNLKPKIHAIGMVINPGEEGHVPGKKNEQANPV